MDSCLRSLVAAVGILGLLPLFAAEKAYTGSGVWSEPSSWNPVGVPESGDRVVFDGAATIAPPASFAGVMSVKGGTLTLVVAEDLSLTLAVATGASLEKTGQGVLKVKPCPCAEAGFVTGGEIAVREGKVQFSGRGRSDAPGFFGPLVIAAGAEAEIVDSPRTGRHGGLVRTVGLNVDTGVFMSIMEPVDLAAFSDKWAAAAADPTLGGDDYWIFVDPESGSVAPFSGDASLPVALRDRSVSLPMVMARGVFVSNGDEVDLTGAGFMRHCSLVDLVQLDTVTAAGFAQTTPLTLQSGWHAFDNGTLLWNAYENWFDVRLRYPTAPTLVSSKCGVDSLWCGVCFGGLTLESGFVFTVADGQAVAFAGSATSFAGSIRGGADTCFALMGGGWAPDWSAFAGFSGEFELGRLATLAPGDIDFGDVPFTASLRGRILASAGLCGVTAANCTGCVEIPQGVSYSADPALLSAGRVRGAGTVTASGVMTVGMLASAAGGASFDSGSSLLVGSKDLMQEKMSSNLPSWSAAGGWSFVHNDVESGVHPACEVVDETLTLVQAPGEQYASAWCQSDSVSLSDDLAVSFTVACNNPKYPEYPITESEGENLQMADTWAFVLQSDSATSLTTRNNGLSPTSFGFCISLYNDMSFTWVTAGARTGAVSLKGEPYGFSRIRPVDVSVGVTNGVMSVRFVQARDEGEQAVFTATRDIKDVFGDAASAWFGFSGVTGYGASYFKCDIGSFSGTVMRPTTCACTVADATQSLSVENWTFTRTSLNGDGELLIQYPEVQGYRCHAICATPLSPHLPFELEFDMRVESHSNPDTNWGDGWAVSFQDAASFGENSAVDGRFPYANNALCLWNNTYPTRYEFQFVHATITGGSTATYMTTTGQSPNGIACETGVPGRLHYKISYDGAGLFTAVITQPQYDRQVSLSQYFETYADMLENKMYLTFTSASAWSSYEDIRISNLTLKRPADNASPVLKTPLSVLAGARVPLTTSSLVAEPATGLTCASVSLNESATLAVQPTDAALGGWVGLDLIRALGSASVAAGAPAVVQLSRIDFAAASPVTVAVDGAWSAKDGALTFCVSESWKAVSGVCVLSVDPSLCRDAALPSVRVVDPSGRLLRRWIVELRDDGYYLVKRGMCVILR